MILADLFIEHLTNNIQTVSAVGSLVLLTKSLSFFIRIPGVFISLNKNQGCVLHDPKETLQYRVTPLRPLLLLVDNVQNLPSNREILFSVDPNINNKIAIDVYAIDFLLSDLGAFKNLYDLYFEL